MNLKRVEIPAKVERDDNEQDSIFFPDCGGGGGSALRGCQFYVCSVCGPEACQSGSQSER
jgi:hypothetical protein